nr:ribbon-helix-helix domain-containing protein [Acidomonas methanolica]
MDGGRISATDPAARAVSDLVKRSFTLSGHRTSVALEPEFWTVLERMAADVPLASLVARLDASRPANRPLASALRVAALQFVKHDRDRQGNLAPQA